MKRSGDAEPSSLERKPLLQQSSSGHINRSAWQPSEVAIDIAPRPLSPHTRGGDHAPGGSISSTGSSSLKGTAVAPGQPSSWEPRQCRICFESEESPEDIDPANPLISPCLCKGSSRYVHRNCLAQWRASSHRQDAYYQCEVCHFRYRYARAWWAAILGSPITLGCVFITVLASFIFVLGFVPILGSSAAAAYGPVITHIANGIVLLGILGLVVSVILGLARACGAATFLWMPDPWCPAAMCIDCQGGGLPVCMELGAGECGMAMMAFLGVLVILLGVVASAVLTWHLLLLGAQIALSKAQHMVENIGAAPPTGPSVGLGQRQSSSQLARSPSDEGEPSNSSSPPGRP